MASKLTRKLIRKPSVVCLFAILMVSAVSSIIDARHLTPEHKSRQAPQTEPTSIRKFNRAELRKSALLEMS
jgi:hypothetical protein